MKILICARDFAPRISGPQRYVMLLAEGFTKSMQCEQVTPNAQHDVRSVTVLTATPVGAFDDSTLPYQVVRRPRFRTLWRLLGEADIVQLASPLFLPMMLGLLRRKPIVIEQHDYQSVCPNMLLFYEPTQTICPGHFMAHQYHKCLRCNAHAIGWRRSSKYLALTFPRRWMCKRVALNVSVTNHVARRIRLPRTMTIYHGVPDVNTDSHRLTLSADLPPCFAYVGRLVTEKGSYLLLGAAKRLKEKGYRFRLKFIGDGPQRPGLEALVGASDLEEFVHFTGFLSGKDLQEALEDVKAVVMPSICEETAGLPAMEQMMRGRLVIAADIGGLGEVVDGTGLKFDVGDLEGLTERLRQALDEPSLAAGLGLKARGRASQLFREERMVNDHLAAYRKLIGARMR